MDICCAILAGGRSTRMGVDKHSLKIGREMLIERVIRKASPIFGRVFIVSKEESVPSFGLPVMKDLLPYGSPLVGIVSALLYAETESVFVLAADMPFLTEEGILYLMEKRGGEDIVLPVTEKGFEPLHAIYRRTCLPYALRNVERGMFSISALFPYLSVKFIRDEGAFSCNGVSVFTNVNTREDLEFARRSLGGDHL